MNVLGHSDGDDRARLLNGSAEVSSSDGGESSGDGEELHFGWWYCSFGI
jgi:hypothetical protein